MKKFLVFLLILFALPVYSQESEDINVLKNLGFFDKPAKTLSPKLEIKHLFKLHEKYTNENNIEGLKTLYAPKYISSDGFNRDTYMKLAEKTWKSFRQLKYNCAIKSIYFTNDTQAMVEVEEHIDGLSFVGNKYIKEGYGFLENNSKCIYMLEKINGKWLIASDNIYFEQTYLTYGEAKFLPFKFISPNQVNAGDNYTISLNACPRKDSLIIASLSKENITFPQISAEEVFRNMPESGTLERVVKANTKNINEYAVTFFVVMKTNNNSDFDKMEMKVSGVGLGMNRVNVVPKNKYIKVEDEKNKEHK